MSPEAHPRKSRGQTGRRVGYPRIFNVRGSGCMDARCLTIFLQLGTQYNFEKRFELRLGAVRSRPVNPREGLATSSVRSGFRSCDSSDFPEDPEQASNKLETPRLVTDM